MNISGSKINIPILKNSALVATSATILSLPKIDKKIDDNKSLEIINKDAKEFSENVIDKIDDNSVIKNYSYVSNDKNTNFYHIQTNKENIKLAKNNQDKTVQLVTKFSNQNNKNVVWCTDLPIRGTNKINRQIYVLYPENVSRIYDQTVNSHNGITPQTNSKLAKALNTSLKNNPIENLKLFKEFFSIDVKENLKLLLNHSKQYKEVYSTLKNNGNLESFIEMCKQNKELFQLFKNIVSNKFDEHIRNSLNQYKGQEYCNDKNVFNKIQNALRNKALNENYSINKDIKYHIDNISSYIDTQIIPNSVKLYRGDGFTALNNVKLENGQTLNLGKLMNDAVQSKNPENIAKVKEFILDHEITAKQPGFMSTSLDINTANLFSFQYENGTKIVWNFDLAPNTKGLYIEGLNTANRFSEQKEVLLQKDTNIKIKDIEYDKDYDIWDIKAELSN